MVFDPSKMTSRSFNSDPRALPPELNALTSRIIGCAIEVHRHLGPGLREYMYERALERELRDAGLRVARQYPFVVHYKGQPLGEQTIDMVVEHTVIVENKAVAKVNDTDHAQLLQLAELPVGLRINFHSTMLKEGIIRKANYPPKRVSPVLSVTHSSLTSGISSAASA